MVQVSTHSSGGNSWIRGISCPDKGQWLGGRIQLKNGKKGGSTVAENGRKSGISK